jgi:high-affinity Fe2+/Pb2+ permease
MINYSSGEKSRARGIVIGVILLVISAGMLYTSIRHHDKSTAGIALLLLLVVGLGLYSATC